MSDKPVDFLIKPVDFLIVKMSLIFLPQSGKNQVSCTYNVHLAPLGFLLLEYDRHDRERIYDNSHMI